MRRQGQHIQFLDTALCFGFRAQRRPFGQVGIAKPRLHIFSYRQVTRKCTNAFTGTPIDAPSAPTDPVFRDGTVCRVLRLTKAVWPSWHRRTPTSHLFKSPSLRKNALTPSPGPHRRAVRACSSSFLRQHCVSSFAPNGGRLSKNVSKY